MNENYITKTFQMDTKLIALSTFFILLNVADILITQFALMNGLSEANPMLADNMSLLIPIKVVGIIIIVTLAIACERLYNNKNAIIAPVLLMVGVVMWNVLQIINAGVI